MTISTRGDRVREDTDMFCCKFILAPGDAELHALKVDDFVFRKLSSKFAPILLVSNCPTKVHVVLRTYVLKSLSKS